MEWPGSKSDSLSDDDKLATTVLSMDLLFATSTQQDSIFLDSDEKEHNCVEQSEILQDASETLNMDETDENVMPPSAAQVFVPSIQVVTGCSSKGNDQWTSLNGSSQSRDEFQEKNDVTLFCAENPDLEKLPFLPGGEQHHLAHSGTLLHQPADLEWPDIEEPEMKTGCTCCDCWSHANLKAMASLVGALIIFPCFLYGAYVFLPFDVPLMPTMEARLIYTLRCGVFATFPIILGIIVYGISRVCSSSIDPFAELKREVELHRLYVADSVQHFVLYFFNLAVLSTFLPQELLKVLPLLTGLFALSRLIYWVSFAFSQAFRSFGFGLTFLPLVSMMLCNFYYMFILEPEKVFAMDGMETSEAETPAPAPKQRFWG
ncbi:transmembrane protein 79 [Protopterus annectens]|uniref:transmembrane protein 79 n=1 Tax=Protopterus annectens TaxID=7888 RepID=UPI001CFBB47E|nr:transmembrane protein 79 [Protopterus annectens]XP_043935748.1 transmembrane protein 79 [Protopterus annectens]